MDEIMSAVFRGCAMARELETDLPSIFQNPALLRTSCEEIAACFASAAQRLQTALDPQEGHAVASAPQVDVFGERMSGAAGSRRLLVVSGQANEPEVGGGEASSRKLEGSSSRPTTGWPVERSSKRSKEVAVTRIVKAPAASTGSLDSPPDDGHTWRKYGQKDIFGARFPRSYYRCTHKSFYGCEAKKHVQRLDDDPLTYKITYVGDHTCRATTAPLALPAIAPVVLLQQETSGRPPPSSTFYSYLPATTAAAAGTSTVFATHTTGMTLLGSPPAAERPSGSDVPGSSCHGRRDGDSPVADLANIMFSSAESAAASVDSIFHSKTADDKGR